MDLQRRQFLQASGLVLAGGWLAGCSSGTGSGGASGKQASLGFWEHNGGLRSLHQKILKEFEASAGGMKVAYHYEPLVKYGQALQLAKQSDQMPDVHTLAGLKIPPAQLVDQGWFQPLDLGDAQANLPADALIGGVHSFGGKTYSFPIISFRQHWTPTWFFADRMEQHDLDPDSPPTTYDEFRTACAQVKRKSGGKVFGWMAKLGAANHMSAELDDLAQAGGFGGVEGLDFVTGEYAFHSDPYVAALEFLLSLKKDGLIHPASVTLPGAQAAVRWAGGEAAFYFDGPWRPGLTVKDTPAVADGLRVGPMLVPQKGLPVTAYRPPQPGVFWVSKDSDHGEAASTLLRSFTTKECFAEMAQSMGQVPLDLEGALAAKDVHPTYRQILEGYTKEVFLAPKATVKNPDVAKVDVQMKPIEPGISETINGLFSGQLTDVRGSLKKVSDRLTAARDEAISAAKKKDGAEVDGDAWAFPNWEPRKDFAADMYPG